MILKIQSVFYIALFTISFDISSQGRYDTLSFSGNVIEESIDSEYMLNHYKTNDYLFMDKGFYIFNKNQIQYKKGFFCLETNQILTSDGVNEGFKYWLGLHMLIDETTILPQETIQSYINIKNKKKLLQKINSIKVRETNYPVTYAFNTNPITEDKLKVYFLLYNNVNISAVRKKEFDFKRYVFTGKRLILTKIPFYYIIKLEVDGHIIR